MSKHRKLLARAKSSPRDFTWDEMCTLLRGLGLEQAQGAGSRVRFFRPEFPSEYIRVHVPHGRHPKTLLVSSVNAVIEGLVAWGLVE